MDPEIIVGRGYAIPPYIHRTGIATENRQTVPKPRHVHRPRLARVIKTVSQFDEPGGWTPVLEKYHLDTLGPTTQHFVTGPPLGNANIFGGYQSLSFLCR